VLAHVRFGDLAEDPAPVAVNSIATCQFPGEFGSACTSARVSSAPVRIARFWTTYGIFRSDFVSLSRRRW